MPKVSIVLPVYNGANHIGEAIDSILKQTYTDYELIIVNDCSTDNTLEIVNQYAVLDNRIRVYSNEKNMKLPATLNAGFEKAVGEYYTWTSDDNLYAPKALETMVNYLSEHMQVGMVYCGMNLIDGDGRFLGKFEGHKLENISSRNVIGACFLYTKKIAKEIGKYDETLFLAEDYDYWLRIYRNSQIAYVDKVLYNYRIHEKSLTKTREYEVKDVALKIIFKNISYFLQELKTPQDINSYFDDIMRLHTYDGNRKFVLKRLLEYKENYIWHYLIHSPLSRLRCLIRK